MCGICGVLSLDGRPVSRPVLARMTETITHRGPEASGVWLEPDAGVVGLGHTRLRIVDLSVTADQPMRSDDGRVQITFNGEIYNHRELRRILVATGARFRTTSDTEVILRLYEAKGERAVAEIDGMFALAIWDGGRRRLLLARDRVGKKPLYYAQTPRLFAFSSEIKGLLQHPALAPEIDTTRLATFFVHGYTPCPTTLYRGVRQVPPGHMLTVDPVGDLRLTEYWDVPHGLTGPPPLTEETAVAEVRRLLTTAVERRLVADVPIGAFLSGGIDSSIVVGLMTRLRRDPVQTFSIGFAGDQAFDETRYANIVAKRFNTLHTTFTVEPSAVELIERLVWFHDGPFGDSSAVPTYLLARLTRQHVTVALTGDGGDELFAGYLRFYATLLCERIPAWLRVAAHRAAAVLPEAGSHRGVVRRLKKLADAAQLPAAERLARWVSVFHEDVSRLLPRVENGGPARSRAAMLATARPAEDARLLHRLLYLNFKTYLLDDLLVKMDRSSMAHALEVRSPFLDTSLVGFAFGLPDRFLLRGHTTKWLLRRAFRDLLPPQILSRGKMGFGVPLRKWFRGDLRDYLGDHLIDPGARLAQYVDARYVRQLCEEHVAGRADHSHRLWTLLTFEIWLRKLPSWVAASVPLPVDGR
jgi:asparagine synthase (glutamine-hydrolysing)